MSTTQLPYPGLRPFERSESDIFFGREEHSDQLLRRLETSRFLAVVGPSGCGKSSLVRAGMIAGLETGYMADAGARWRVAIMRPGASPFRKLAEALLDKAAMGPEQEGHENAVLFLEATLRRGPLGLVEALRETPLPQGTNLLVLADQFEEIFRFRAIADHDEADAFVALLLASAAQREVPLYVVLTMRSDYLGDCAVFTGLPEALNESQYLTPRLTREQRRSAIVGPARVFGGDVEPQLVNRILNEMGPEPDLLPVFQHLLMRMWTYDRPGGSTVGDAGPKGAPFTEDSALVPAPTGKTEPGTRLRSSSAMALTIAEPDTEVSGRILALVDYQAVGGFANALSKHANEVFDGLNAKQQQTATLLFRRLCERGGRLRDVRRPTPIHDIMDLAHLRLDEVTTVADAFRSPEHNFLAPSFPELLTSETVLDITHESLIRQWDRLNKWVELEKESARTYRFLEETARLWKEGRAALWGSPNLEEALSWQERECPTEEWAKRYGGDFTLAKEFLEASRQKHISDVAQAKAQQERRLRRAHRITASLALTVVVLIAGILMHRYLWVWAYEADYKSFVKVAGEPKGIDQLTSGQVHHRAVSIRIIREGRWGRVTEMQAVNSRGDLTPLHGIGTYLQRAEEQSPSRECDWKFSYDSQGQIANEIAYNRLGKMMWGFAYSPSQEKNTSSREAYYLGPDGYPNPEKGSAASFVHFEYSKDGYEHRVRYRDRLARPMPGPDKAFGQELIYDNQGRVIEMKSLDPDGKPMNDEAGNSSLRMTYDESGNVLTSNAYDASGLPTVVTEGWSQRRSKYDENGNEIETAYFDEAGRPALHKDGYHRQTSIVDERGYIAEQRFWDFEGKAAVSSYGYHAIRLAYNDLGYTTQITYLDNDDQPIPDRTGVVTQKLRYENDRQVELAFFDAKGNPVVSNKGYHKLMFKYDDRGNRIEVAYFESDGKPTKSVNGYARFASKYNANDQLIRQEYYDDHGQPTTGKSTYASRTFKYDDRGNLTEESYFDINRQPTDVDDGYATWWATYDPNGNAVKTGYFGRDGQAVLNRRGYAGFTSKYDHLGNETRRAYFGLHNEPVRSDEGIAGWTSEYDAVGNETGKAYFDPNGSPTALSMKGYASWHATFDRGGHRTELAFFDSNHKPVLSTDGYALARMKYDARGNVIRMAYLGVVPGKLILAGENKDYASVVHRYDQGGNQIESAYFGIHDERVLLKDGYHLVQGTYDNHNNPVDIRFYGSHGEAVETSDGYARLIKHFDKYGNVIDNAIFGVSGAPVAVDGCYKVVNRYDERQRRIEDRCVGLDGHLAPRADGSAVRKFQYDARGNETEVAYFGTRSEPIGLYGKGQHRVAYAYDNRDNEIEEEYFNTDGKPMIGIHQTETGFELCRRWTRYDQAGRPVGQCIK